MTTPEASPIGTVELEKRLRRLTGEVRGGFWLASAAQDRFLFVSARCEDLWQIDAATLTRDPRRILQAIHPDDRARAAGVLTSRLRGRCEVEYRILRQDGSVRWIRHCAIPEMDESGHVRSIAGTAEDVTEIAEARAQARRMAERAKAITAAASSIVGSASVEDLEDNLRQACATLMPFDTFVLAVSPDGRDEASTLDRGTRRGSSGSSIRVPIVSGGSSLGSIALSSPERAKFDQQDVQVLESLAALAGTALLNVRSFEERRAAEAALQNSERHFRALTEAAHDVVVVLNPGGTIRFQTAAVQRLLGHSPSDLTDRSLFEFVHPDEVAGVVEAVMRTEPGPGAGRDLHFRFRHRDGTWRTLQAMFRNLLHEPSVGGIVITAHDVTDRERVQESNEQLASMLEATTDVVATSDSHGRILYLNRAGRELLGLSPGEVPKLNLPDLHPTEAATVILREAFPAALREGVWSGETVLADRTGGSIPVSQVILVQRDPSGAVQFIATIMRDLSQQKRAEEELRRREEHFRALIEASSDVIGLLAEDGSITYLSPSASRMLGYASGEHPARHIGELLHPEDARRAREIRSMACANPGVPQTAQLRVAHADGSWRVVEASAKDLRRHTSVDGILFTARDITANVEAEEALRQSEEQLRQSQKMEAVGRLAGGVAHDFNNLLTAIKGHAYLALAELDPDEALHIHMGEIDRAADRAAALTRQLLAFSRRQVLQPEVLDLNAIIAEMESMLRPVIGEHVMLSTALELELAPVVADPGQIGQVLMNLVVNARDAMPDGGEVRIESRTLVLEQGAVLGNEAIPPGRYSTFLVRDNGTSIPPEIQCRIFEPFFTTKEVNKGTGLGLSTVYGIVKQSGGHIWFESNPGSGTVFCVALPQVETVAAVAGAATRRLNDAPKGSEVVLIVEDEPAVRSLASRLLARHGYQVLEAVGPEEALRLVERHDGPIDLLLTDVVMPEMNGYELARRIKADRPLQVLYMSGYDEDAIRRDGNLESAASLIEKPFTPDALVRRIREVLDRSADAAILID